MSENKQNPITQQPGHRETPFYRVVTGTEEWSNEMFGCLDGGISANDHLCMYNYNSSVVVTDANKIYAGLKTTFCPCLVYGKQQERLRNPSLQNYERINHDSLLYAGATYLCGLSWVYAIYSPTLIFSAGCANSLTASTILNVVRFVRNITSRVPS